VWVYAACEVEAGASVAAHAEVSRHEGGILPGGIVDQERTASAPARPARTQGGVHR
jgi:hypothetical protein